MAIIYQYKKHIDSVTTIYMKLPEDTIYNELAVIDGITYVSVPDNVVLPEQPTEISVTVAEITDDLRSRLRKESAHLQLIDNQFTEKLRKKYSVEDELYFNRIAIGFLLGKYVFEDDEMGLLSEYQQFVEDLREWARNERKNLGL
jgi:hypothetical protein